MERRDFVKSALASATASALSLDGTAQTPAQPPTSRQFFQLRRYSLQTGPQTALTEHYFAAALIPALNRLGLQPVGAFRLDVGPETPTFYLLIPGASVELLGSIDLRLAEDAEFLQAAEPFWSAPATAPAFLRVESTLHACFQGWPRITPPAASATHAPRIFQLRIYESPSYKDHVLKVELFNNGEIDIFRNAGFHPVFFGDRLIGPLQPCLAYMLSFANSAELEAQWNVFRNDPAWKKLSTSPRYGYEAIVSNITNLYLSPLAASQI
jgi:hypothetical protein